MTPVEIGLAISLSAIFLGIWALIWRSCYIKATYCHSAKYYGRHKWGHWEDFKNNEYSSELDRMVIRVRQRKRCLTCGMRASIR